MSYISSTFLYFKLERSNETEKNTLLVDIHFAWCP